MPGDRRRSRPRPEPNRAEQIPRKQPVPPFRPMMVPDSSVQPSAPRPVNRPSLPRRNELSPVREDGQLQRSQRSPANSLPLPPPDPDDRRSRRRRRTSGLPRLRLPTSWQFWVTLTILLFSTAGGLSAALLLKLPALPNCPSIFWPTASGSLRLYCAQLAANKQTVEDLLEAIALVNALPNDHPLRPEINRYIETWSLNILDLGDQAFDRGELQEAIAIANKIPDNTPAHQLVEERIQRWQSIWADAEAIYQEAETALEKQDLRAAFAIAVRLLYVDNTYWETTKYQELTELIEVARVEGSKIARANSLKRRGGISNLLAAVKLLEEIKSGSSAYSQVQALIVEIGKKMLDLAEAQLDRRDAQEAIAIVRQIPGRAGLQNDAQDFIALAMAQELAWQGTTTDLESAIIQAQRLDSDRPLYGRAQQLISRWQLEIQDVIYLERARQLAQSGDLVGAIAEAQQIPRGNPRGSEARDEIDRWTTQVQTTEDRPLLTEAERLASGGDVLSLQAAINQASRIERDRALYGDARQRIQEWTSRIQRTQDQPYLDRARQLAALGNLDGAIATAQQIASGRTLYEDAQADINRWRSQSEGETRMRAAYQSASTGSSATFLDAIRTADQVSANSSIRTEADRMINIWSYEILRIAEQEATYSLEQAIATASTVPSRTEAYAAAQLQIQAWSQQVQGVVESEE